MTPEEFEALLDQVAETLTDRLRSSLTYHGPEDFEKGVLDTLGEVTKEHGAKPERTFNPRAFPDIRVNDFGVEVKYSKRDTWSAAGNSVFEGMRDHAVQSIYVVFGKVGGEPEVRWAKYEDCVKHVRVSNAPRFVVDMDSEERSLFEQFDIEYDDFAKLEEDTKMEYIRDYWRERIKPGGRLWWLEPSHTLPLNVRFYRHLSKQEKRVLRAEAALLCPQICKGRNARGKYDDAAIYLLTYHGVFCPQARDLFTAGSVASQGDGTKGGKYVLKALSGIEDLMVDAAKYMDNALFEEYWGSGCEPDQRIGRWLQMADGYAKDWRPSEHLFQDRVS